MNGLNRAHLASTEIDLTLREFERYHDQMERYFVQERARIDEEFNTFDPRKIDDTGHAIDYIDYLSDCYKELETSFPSNFRSSFLIQIISFIEYELKKICNLHAEFTKSVFTLKDFRGNGEFDQMKVYLEKVANIDFNTVDPEWETLQKIYKVRNRFVHQTGIVQEKEAEMKAILKSMQHISTKTETEQKDSAGLEYSLILKKEFNKQLVQTATEFFRKLLFNNLSIPMNISDIFDHN